MWRLKAIYYPLIAALTLGGIKMDYSVWGCGCVDAAVLNVIVITNVIVMLSALFQLHLFAII